jgi:hypothetical protein
MSVRKLGPHPSPLPPFRKRSPPFRRRSRAAYLPPRELRREAGDEEDERDDDGHEDAEPQHQPAERDQWRRLRLALAEFLHEAMRLLARVRGEPLRLLAELRVQVVVGVARGRALARRPARIGRPLTLFIHGHSFAAIPLVRLPRVSLSRVVGPGVVGPGETLRRRKPKKTARSRQSGQKYRERKLTSGSDPGTRFEELVRELGLLAS